MNLSNEELARLRRLLDIVLDASQAQKGYSLSQLSFIIGRYETLLTMLEFDFGIAAPSDLRSTWGVLEITYALALESGQEFFAERDQMVLIDAVAKLREMTIELIDTLPIETDDGF